MGRYESAALALTLLAACGGQQTSDPPDAAAPDVAVEAAVHDAAATCTCAPPPPPGFRYVVMSNDVPLGCPTGWDAPEDLIDVAGPTGDATCSCACDAATDVSCTVTSLQLLISGGGVCYGVPQTISLSGCTAADGGATATSTLSAEAYLVSPTTSATCGAPHGTAIIPPVSQQPVRICNAPNLYGGCASPKVCLTPTQSNNVYQWCIVSADANAVCPSDFPTRHTLASSVSDTRHCGGCSCTPYVNCSPTLSLYDDDACTNLAATVSASCKPLGITSVAFSSVEATTAPTATCQPGNPGLIGSLAFDGTRVACCH